MTKSLVSPIFLLHHLNSMPCCPVRYFILSRQHITAADCKPGGGPSRSLPTCLTSQRKGHCHLPSNKTRSPSSENRITSARFAEPYAFAYGRVCNIGRNINVQYQHQLFQPLLIVNANIQIHVRPQRYCYSQERSYYRYRETWKLAPWGQPKADTCILGISMPVCLIIDAQESYNFELMSKSRDTKLSTDFQNPRAAKAVNCSDSAFLASCTYFAKDIC
jgi:hypothetical protein